MLRVDINPEDYYKDDIVVDYHHYRDMPWVDKSKYGDFKFCPWNFQMNELDRISPKPIEAKMEEAMHKGTNLHLTSALFFNVIEDKNLVPRIMEIPRESLFKESQMYWSFVDICNQVVPKGLLKDAEHQRFVSNFCQYEVDYWNYIVDLLGATKDNMHRYWVPFRREMYLENYDQMLYGTVDVLQRNPLFGTSKGRKMYGYPFIVIDYKTGKTPKSVMEGEGIPTDKLEELHLYCWLVANAQTNVHMVKVKTMNDDLVEVEQEKREFDWVFPELKQDFMNLGCNILYLGEDKPWYVKPRNTREKTMENVWKGIKNLRNTWKAGGPWTRETNEFKCRSCHQVTTCLDEDIVKAAADE